MELCRHKREPRRPGHVSSKCAESCSVRLANRTEISESHIKHESDPEVRKEVLTSVTQSSKRCGLGAERFSRFSRLHSLQRAIANLIVIVKVFKRRKASPQESKREKAIITKNRKQLRNSTAKKLQQAIKVMVRTVQRVSFSSELNLGHYVWYRSSESQLRGTSREETCPKGIPTLPPGSIC